MKISDLKYCKQDLLDAIDLFLKGNIDPSNIIQLFSESYLIHMMTVENNETEDEESSDLINLMHQ